MAVLEDHSCGPLSVPLPPTTLRGRAGAGVGQAVNLGKQDGAHALPSRGFDSYDRTGSPRDQSRRSRGGHSQPREPGAAGRRGRSERRAWGREVGAAQSSGQSGSAEWVCHAATPRRCTALLTARRRGKQRGRRRPSRVPSASPPKPRSRSRSWRRAMAGSGTCLGAWARVTIDHFRHLALQTWCGHSGFMNILANQMFKYV